MNMKKYVIKKIVTDFVVINIIINGIFYVVNFRRFSGQLTFSDIATDLFVGLIFLGCACSSIGFVNMRKELLKGKHDMSDFQTSQLYSILPKRMAVRVLVLAAMTALISASLFILLPKVLGLDKINHIVGFGFKTLTAGLMASVIGYVVIDVSISDYQHGHAEIKDTTIV